MMILKEVVELHVEDDGTMMMTLSMITKEGEIDDEDVETMREIDEDGDAGTTRKEASGGHNTATTICPAICGDRVDKTRTPGLMMRKRDILGSNSKQRHHP